MALRMKGMRSRSSVRHQKILEKQSPAWLRHAPVAEMHGSTWCSPFMVTRQPDTLQAFLLLILHHMFATNAVQQVYLYSQFSS